MRRQALLQNGLFCVLYRWQWVRRQYLFCMVWSADRRSCSRFLLIFVYSFSVIIFLVNSCINSVNLSVSSETVMNATFHSNIKTTPVFRELSFFVIKRPHIFIDGKAADFWKNAGVYSYIINKNNWKCSCRYMKINITDFIMKS